MAKTASEFLLIFRESTPERYDAMPAEQRRAALDDWNAWCDDLVERGKLQSGNTLAPDGRMISAEAAAKDAAENAGLDGPFSEAKEVIGGYFLLAADNLDEAESIARESPNLKYGMTVEIRPIDQACHLARSLGMESMREPPDQPA